jgi:DNA-binding MarR family transcriptional regulator
MNHPSDLSMKNYELIKQLFLVSDDNDRRLLSSYDLSVARYNALRHLAECDVLTPTDLGRLLLCDKANVTRLLSVLERDGLVKRRQDPSDGRRTSIHLTQAGQDRLTAAHRSYQGATDNLFDCLSPEEEKSLHALLSRLKTAWEGSLAESSRPECP